MICYTAPWGFFLALILRQGLMEACFCSICSSLAFSPTYFSHLSPFLPLSSLYLFTKMLSSPASLSCFDTVLKYSVLPETLSIPHHWPARSSVWEPSTSTCISAQLCFSLFVFISTTLSKKHCYEVPEFGDCKALLTISLEDILGLVCVGVPRGI